MTVYLSVTLILLPPLPAPARDMLATRRRQPATQPDPERGERADSLWKGRAIVAHVEPSFPSPHQLEMCLRRLDVDLPLSSVWTGGGGYLIFGNGNLFPGNKILFPMFDVWKRKCVSWKQVSVSGNENGFSVSYVLCYNQTPQKPVFSFKSTIYTLSYSLHWLFYFSSCPFHPDNNMPPKKT